MIEALVSIGFLIKVCSGYVSPQVTALIAWRKGSGLKN